jgi:RHS repeat-associated protein
VNCRYTLGTQLISQERRTDGSSSTWTVSYYGHDGLGSTRALYNASGVATDTYNYTAYGKMLAQLYVTTQTSQGPQGTPTVNNYLFAGEQWDPDLKLYYNRARYLNVDSGRFTSRDTFEGGAGDIANLHRYLYVGADPQNGVDPTGNDLASTLTTMGIGAAIGGASGALADVAMGKAITMRSVLQGVALGALMGPAAEAFPTLAAVAGVGGAIYSGLTFGPILLDPGATTQQKVASSVLIITSIYGAKAGMEYAKAANAKRIPTVAPPSEEYVTLEHGTTMDRAISIFRNGPDETFVEPGGEHTTPAGGISTLEVGSLEPVGSTSQYAVGKATSFPDEGGGAILRFAVPKAIYMKAIKLHGEIRFVKGRGLEELQAAWNKSVYRFPPKSTH